MTGQTDPDDSFRCSICSLPVSYTHLDVYKRQVYGDDISLQISEFARMSGVSKVVMGRYRAKKKYLFSRQSLTDRLIELAPNLEIYVIPDKDVPYYNCLLYTSRCV